MPSCIGYADDTVLFFATKTAIEQNLICIYGSHQRLKKEDRAILFCNGSPLTESDSFKYLEVVIDKHLQKSI